MKQAEWNALCETERAGGGDVVALSLTAPSAVELVNDVLSEPGTAFCVSGTDGTGTVAGAFLCEITNRASGTKVTLTVPAEADTATVRYKRDGSTRTWHLGDSARELEKQKLLWACRCGKGGRPDLSPAADAESARAETERQVLEHLREEGHDPAHSVYVGTFSAWCALGAPEGRIRTRDALVELDPPRPRELLWHEAGTLDGPDYCTAWDGKLTAAGGCALCAPAPVTARAPRSALTTRAGRSRPRRKFRGVRSLRRFPASSTPAGGASTSRFRRAASGHARRAAR